MKDLNQSMTLGRKIAEKVKDLGGTAYFVGGCVRDIVMKRPFFDIDIEVHGIEEKTLYGLLSSLGQVQKYGKSFGIYSIKGYNTDIALPRQEVATGPGHRDFDIICNPHLGEKNAAMRRDFTINALMQDILTGEILDFFGGLEDIRRQKLRHVSNEHFGEDPLRVLRGAQFAARLGFDTHESTLDIYSKTDLSHLSSERVMEELSKALILADKPSVFFETLRRANALEPWFCEIRRLVGVEQSPLHHAEGDVWNHTMMVLDEGARLRDKVCNPRGFMLGILCHDLGKTVTTQCKDGKIHAYGHEEAGVEIAEGLVDRLTKETDTKKYVLNLVRLHMKPGALASAGVGIKSTNHLFDKAVSPRDLVYFFVADNLGKLPRESIDARLQFLTDRLEVYKETMSRPHVTGEDLIKCGLCPHKGFREILAYAHKLRLAGVSKEDALKQCLAYKGDSHSKMHSGSSSEVHTK